MCDWKEAYNQVIRILSAMKHSSPRIICYPSRGIVTYVNIVLKFVLH
jgi:hypothetical protein